MLNVVIIYIMSFEMDGNVEYHIQVFLLIKLNDLIDMHYIDLLYIILLYNGIDGYTYYNCLYDQKIQKSQPTGHSNEDLLYNKHIFLHVFKNKISKIKNKKTTNKKTHTLNDFLDESWQ